MNDLIKREDVFELMDAEEDFLCGCKKDQYKQNDDGMEYHNDECFFKQFRDKINQLPSQKFEPQEEVKA